jgi:hypothetical protein
MAAGRFVLVRAYACCWTARCTARYILYYYCYNLGGLAQAGAGAGAILHTKSVFFLPMNETSSVAFVFSGGAPAAPCDEAITFSIIKNTISCGSELN